MPEDDKPSETEDIKAVVSEDSKNLMSGEDDSEVQDSPQVEVEKTRHSLGDGCQHCPLHLFNFLIRIVLCIAMCLSIYVFILAIWTASMEAATDSMNYKEDRDNFKLIYELVITSGVLFIVVFLILFVQMINLGRLLFDAKPWTPEEWSALRAEASKALYKKGAQ